MEQWKISQLNNEIKKLKKKLTEQWKFEQYEEFGWKEAQNLQNKYPVYRCEQGYSQACRVHSEFHKWLSNCGYIA